MFDPQDQRDHAEEAANRTHVESEAASELAAERAEQAEILRRWRATEHTTVRVALIAMCDRYVRSQLRGVEVPLMVIMVNVVAGFSADEASVIVSAEAREAYARLRY